MTLIQHHAPPLEITTLHSRLVFGVSIVFFVLATIAVLLRIYARRLKRLSFVAEDYLVFFALFGFFTQIILTCCAVIYGAAGRPQNTVSPENVEASLQILAGQGVCYGLAMTCSKWSICLLYKRIFVIRSFRMITYFIMALIFGWGVLAFTVTWAFCSPIAYGWDITIPGGHCANRDAGYLVVGIVDAITDLLILILPMPMIWKLHLPRVKQISLIFIFSIAILSIVVSALRAYYTSIVDFNDFTDSRTYLDIFSSIEPATSIIVASSLVYGPVIKKWLPHISFSQPSANKHTSHSFQRIHEHDTNPVQGVELGHTPKGAQGSESVRGNQSTVNSSIQSHLPQNGLPQAHANGAPAVDGITVQREFMIQQDSC